MLPKDGVSSLPTMVARICLCIRCYNCGQFANHIAAKCSFGPQPRRCHNCSSEDHLIADCPSKTEQKTDSIDSTKNGDTPKKEDGTTVPSAPEKTGD
ncbi:protein lin-28 homolog isoform X2 [Coccinella septempunctata]|uniref:protein lin-28 homolog isoform X2 n=1 Tax=Coccinella septempunctata TaxID=41139 RepID=UPI001D07473F|nr:protein lin-28 homolog isoform X2 [Coccinella septempunctata]XP_044764283.1 protein lin-28 homolog isoform X2 [Coccinella septempunctata]